jgi:hypothetical protein
MLPLSSHRHPDKPKVDEMLAHLDEMAGASEDDPRKADEVIFKDNLWNPSPCNAPPTGTVPENVTLALNAVRILVACSLTTCRERDDFQPGKLGGVGRLYPHVMVVATFALDRVEAGVHFKRPEETTVIPDADGDPHAHHHHMSGSDEVLPKLKSLLIADSNKGGMVLERPPLAPGPIPFWANMFTYYVVNPIDDADVGDKLIPIVRRSQTCGCNEVGSVTRDCSDIRYFDEEDTIGRAANQNRVLKRERQGYFDNLHIAPRMAVKAPIDHAILTYGSALLKPVTVVPFTTYEAWKMDEVVMAPFCAHDCFHMHWRWSDNFNNEPGSYGWGPVNPWSKVGGVMVPENQDVFLQLLGHAEVSYIAQAHGAPNDAWQPFCHHGTAYALRVGTPMEIARDHVHLSDHMAFYPPGPNADKLDGTSWALFYWRLRYRLVPSGATSWGAYHAAVVEERFRFNNEPKALDE